MHINGYQSTSTTLVRTCLKYGELGLRITRKNCKDNSRDEQLHVININIFLMIGNGRFSVDKGR